MFCVNRNLMNIGFNFPLCPIPTFTPRRSKGFHEKLSGIKLSGFPGSLQWIVRYIIRPSLLLLLTFNYFLRIKLELESSQDLRFNTCEKT